MNLKQAWGRLRQHFWLSLLFDSLLILLVFIAIHAWQTRDLPLDEPAPQTVLQLLDGSGLAPAIQPGEVGIVYFFAPWCTYCKLSIDNLDSLVASGSVAWGVTIALDYGDAAEVQEFVDDTGISLPVLMGGPATAADWSVRGFPTYYVIDSRGQIASRSVGYSTKAGMWARAGMTR